MNETTGAPPVATLGAGTCRRECAVTWHSWHGPGRETPGTQGHPGAVRLCEHGRVWQFERTFENRFFCDMDRWRPVSKWWPPLLYRRALRALADQTRGAQP